LKSPAARATSPSDNQAVDSREVIMRGMVSVALAWQPVIAVLAVAGLLWALILPPLVTGDPASSLRGAVHLMIWTGKTIFETVGIY
jgi:hypothetical protein